MYKIVPFSDDLDLENFYRNAGERGFHNNANRHMLVDCFRNERAHQTWILYYDYEPVGSVAAHTFDEMGDYAYRIAARTCVFTDRISTPSLRTRNQIITHQHVTGQFLIPICIEWAGRKNDLYITSNNLESGSQRLVHNIYFPAMADSGQVEQICELNYRGTLQTVWKINVDRFYEELTKYPRWN